MHPPERGFGKPPRSQQSDQAGVGSRPLLQGHLKANRKKPREVPPKEPPSVSSATSKASARKTAPGPKAPSARPTPAGE